ncbi:hypothetical protein [Pararhodonellum marinum]|uniref:hypothetical protein n=1 Tax=Pararhodonellum marinum TaxID=2755358 RepID=UPI00188FC47B|nr:hypothetical protein [Pararhodonellum marinum]
MIKSSETEKYNYKMIFRYLILFLISILVIACSKGQTIKQFENKLDEIKNWNFKIAQSKTDTTNLVDWFPESEINIVYSLKSDSNCLSPSFDFYPIELEKYIEKKLLNYLILRATLFPPAPKTYRTEKYFVIGWNLVDYDSFKCCECSDLEKEIINKLGLKIKTDPQEIDKLIREN